MVVFVRKYPVELDQILRGDSQDRKTGLIVNNNEVTVRGNNSVGHKPVLLDIEQ